MHDRIICPKSNSDTKWSVSAFPSPHPEGKYLLGKGRRIFSPRRKISVEEDRRGGGSWESGLSEPGWILPTGHFCLHARGTLGFVRCIQRPFIFQRGTAGAGAV